MRMGPPSYEAYIEGEGLQKDSGVASFFLLLLGVGIKSEGDDGGMVRRPQEKFLGGN